MSDTGGVVVDARVAERGVDLRLDLPPGRILAVLGPNGAGKSTLLGLLSGLVAPSSGTVRIGERVVADPRGMMPPHRRGVGLMSQDPLLFPHLSCLENVAFGPRSQGVPAREARTRARTVLESVGATEFAERLPGTLSGGQQQRVALARALAAEPTVLLLDEPLAALDVDVAARMRRVLAAHVREAGRTTILVTHDLLDVLAIADDVAVIEDGAVVERGAALEVLRRPRSRFAARLAGLNLLEGTLETRDGRANLTLPGGTRLTGTPSGGDAGSVAGPTAGPAAEVREGPTAGVALVRPSAVALYPADVEDAPGSPRNRLRMRIETLEELSGSVRARGVLVDEELAAKGGGAVLAADVTPASAAELGLAPGVEVMAVVKATEVEMYPRG